MPMLILATAASIAIILFALVAFGLTFGGRSLIGNRDLAIARTIADIEARLTALEKRFDTIPISRKIVLARGDAERAPSRSTEDRLDRLEERFLAIEVPITDLLRAGRRERIVRDLRAILNAAELYRASCGDMPESLDALASGKCGDGSTESGLFVESTKDPWGNDYRFELDPDGVPRAWCLGADGAEGGSDEDEDVRMPDE